MSTHSIFPSPQHMDRMSQSAAVLGFEIVDLAGFLDIVETQAERQRKELADLGRSARTILGTNTDSRESLSVMIKSSDDTTREMKTSVEMIQDMGKSSRDIAEWVQDLSGRTEDVSGTLKDVKKNNSQIASISMQVNTLAINAKIEAARAGESGLGFAVVANAINELSQDTKAAAAQISANVETLTSWISTLGKEAKDIAEMAAHVLEHSETTDQTLGRMESSMATTHEQVRRIQAHSETGNNALNAFEPKLNSMESSVQVTGDGIKEAHARILRLIDTSEAIVQASAAIGGVSADERFIAYVREAAQQASTLLSQELTSGRITKAQMFDTNYRPIEGTNPPQMRTAFTDLTDKIMPAIQEAALDFDKSIVFCAAIDRNGYLPTHNRKFSHPHSDDPVWNMANCRNRRIFDDRVGLKAGRSTEPFLLQVYRRDMGAGKFVMMKDLSAPITIDGQHWGGLRLAYTF